MELSHQQKHQLEHQKESQRSQLGFQLAVFLSMCMQIDSWSTNDYGLHRFLAEKC